MPEVLKLTQLVKHNEVPECKIGTSWIDAQFDTQRLVAMEAVFEFSLTDDSFGVDTDGFGSAHFSEFRSQRSKISSTTAKLSAIYDKLSVSQFP